jgi:hypothetical protein
MNNGVQDVADGVVPGDGRAPPVLASVRMTAELVQLPVALDA